MPLRDLAMLDDATFDVGDAQVADGRVVLRGWAVEHGTSVGTARLPVTLTVPNAVDVSADSVGGTGELVLDRVEVTPTTVTLVGVAPARIVVTTSVQSQALLEVGTTPIAVRRWGRWRPWARPHRWSSTTGTPSSGCGPRPVRSASTRGLNTRWTRTNR